MQPSDRNWNPFLYGGILAVIAVAVVYFVAHGAIGQKEIAAAFLAMVGTFLGALFAFRLNQNKEDTKLEKEHKAALNRALFVIVRQYNAIRSLEKELEPFKTEFERAFTCPAIRPPSYSDLVHDFEALDFFLEVADPNLLMRLSVEQEGFHQAIDSLRVRNDFYVNEVQPVIAKHGFHRRPVPAQEFQAALGERLFNGAVMGATALYSHVAACSRSLPAIHGELFAAAKEQYPNAKFVQLAPEA